MTSPLSLECAPEDVGLDSGRLEKITPWMQGYVDDGKLPGALTAVVRRNKLVYLETAGMMDVEAAKPLQADTIFRFYSMTKPITTVAAMMLYEQGLFQLDDPVSKFLPALGGLEVFTGGDETKYTTEPAAREMTVRDLMNHTSGLTYGWMEAGPVDALYREHDVNFQESGQPLAVLIERLGKLPLLAHPGTQWNYSVSTDVLGHLVEVLSGQQLDAYFAERILEPLGMLETSFTVAADKMDRFAAMYTPREDGSLKRIDGSTDSRFTGPAVTFSGGGGLTSTAADYIRFCRFLRNKGELDGVRLLGRKSVELMTTNHLPGDMADMGQATFAESTFEGIGFGLGFAVMIDPAKAQIVGTPGEYNWGGAASTAFWVDPAEDLFVLFLTQLLPSSTYPLRRELKVLTYQAIID